MNQETIQQVVDEIGPLLAGRRFGKIFQLSLFSFAIDFGLRDGRFLFVSTEPAAPRVYLIKRRVKDLDKASTALSQFGQTLRARLSGAKVLGVNRDPNERVVRFLLLAQDEIGAEEARTFLVQLTGRSSNLFLLDEDARIIAALREASLAGQIAGDVYETGSAGGSPQKATSAEMFEIPAESISEELDSFYSHQEKEKLFQANARNLQARLRKQIRQKAKLKENLEKDLEEHGDAQMHKRLGDLLLANLATAKRIGSKVLIQDFYAEGAPTLELDVEEGKPLQEEAARYFDLYTKSKRAGEQIAIRLNTISREIEDLLEQEAKLEAIIQSHDEEALSSLLSQDSKGTPSRSRRAKPAKIPGVRAYKSSDGYEVLVGRGARDNDHLTFRVARPNDLWLHTADYPGSHVIVRRENRKEIPHRTIVEAAQLAAKFSQASNDAKVAVHYTARKFLSKPRGAAPGLVRMSSFKTILVEPKEAIERA